MSGFSGNNGNDGGKKRVFGGVKEVVGAGGGKMAVFGGRWREDND